jgi:hypothetical protein
MRFGAAFARFRRMVLGLAAVVLFAAAPLGALTAAAFGPVAVTPGLHAALATEDGDHGHSHDADETQAPALGHTHDHNPADHVHEGAARPVSVAFAGNVHRTAGTPARGPSPAPSPGFPLERPPRG